MKVNIRKLTFVSAILLIMTLSLLLASCTKKEIIPLKHYDISVAGKVLENNDYLDLYKLNMVADKGKAHRDSNSYLAHPDYMQKGDSLYVFYVKGHGRGTTAIKKSVDHGRTWSEEFTNLPTTFDDTQETPTVYELNADNKAIPKYVLISARPGWSSVVKKGEGFDVATSNDLENWTAHENFYGPKAKQEKYIAKQGDWNPIVAMASLIRIKENGKFVDKWMGFFHDYDFYMYSSILSFDDENKMQWSEPKKIFTKYREIESKYKLCEPCVIRSDANKGNELTIIMRSEARNSYSFVATSNDEGLTWTMPTESIRDLSGHRHKAQYLPDGRLIMTFRFIDYYSNVKKRKYAFSRGFFVWIGEYENIKNNKQGQYLIKVAHAYEKDNNIQAIANYDTGYAGIAVFDSAENTEISLVSYGKFDSTRRDNTGIWAKTFKLKILESAVADGTIKYVE